MSRNMTVNPGFVFIANCHQSQNCMTRFKSVWHMTSESRHTQTHGQADVSRESGFNDHCSHIEKHNIEIIPEQQNGAFWSSSNSNGSAVYSSVSPCSVNTE